MSADNWTTCPKCKATAEAKANEVARIARASYGKVPLEEYQRMIDVADRLANHGLAKTFREDFQIGMMPDGTFTVVYRGSCDVCKFSHDFQHAKKGDLTP